MKAFIRIGCHGRKSTGITICPGFSTEIIDLRRLPSNREDILDYLEKHIKLFDNHTADINKIGSVVSFLTQEGIVIKHREAAIHELIAMHKKCGLYIYVDPLDENI